VGEEQGFGPAISRVCPQQVQIRVRDGLKGRGRGGRASFSYRNNVRLSLTHAWSKPSWTIFYSSPTHLEKRQDARRRQVLHSAVDVRLDRCPACATIHRPCRGIGGAGTATQGRVKLSARSLCVRLELQAKSKAVDVLYSLPHPPSPHTHFISHRPSPSTGRG
jgi:hypothetical protein